MYRDPLAGPILWRIVSQQITKGCILWRINRRETSSWWTTAAIQRCSQTTPKGYTHLGDPCTRSTTVEAGHTQGKSHIEEKILQKYQHDHNLRHSLPDPSAPVIFCVNCGRGFKSQTGLFSHQRAKHVTDEPLH